MSSKARRLLLGFVLAALLLYLFFRGVDWGSIRAAFHAADRRYLLGMTATTIVLYALRSWRWGFLLAPLARVSFTHLFSATLIGFTSGMLVPRAGELVRPYLVARRYPIPISTGFASIILERLVDLMTVLFLFALYLYILPMPAAQSRGPLLGSLRLGVALAGSGALVVLVLLFALHHHADPVLAFLERVLARVLGRFLPPVMRALRAFAQGLAVLQASPGHLLVIFGQSLLLWLTIALGFYWNNLAFGIDLPFHTTFLMMAFLTVGVAVPTPGTVGGFHVFYLMALTEAYGVPKDTAAAAGIACHALSNLPVLVLGLAFLGREGLTVGKVAEMTDSTEASS